MDLSRGLGDVYKRQVSTKIRLLIKHNILGIKRSTMLRLLQIT
jgi:hypothetical protein